MEQCTDCMAFGLSLFRKSFTSILTESSEAYQLPLAFQVQIAILWSLTQISSAEIE